MNWPVVISTMGGFAVGVVFACWKFKTGQWSYDK